MVSYIEYIILHFESFRDSNTLHLQFSDFQILYFLFSPWCFVGKRNLETALSKLDHDQIDVNIKWSAYQLAPTLTKSVDKWQSYIGKFGDRAEGIKKRLNNVGLNCAPPIRFKWGGMIGNTLNSHRLVMLGTEQGKGNDTVEMVMQNYFELNRDINDDTVLIDIGQNLGLSVNSILYIFGITTEL